MNARSLLEPVRLGQFLSVGILGGLVDNAVLVSLVEGGSIEPVVAAVGAKEASILVMFLVNDNWTFADQDAATGFARAKRFLKSNVVRSGGALVGIATLHVLSAWFGVWYLLANVLGICVGFFFNYTLESLVTWRVHRSADALGADD
jgi:putative flippase GtrA